MPFANRFQLFSSLSCFNFPDSASAYVVNDSIDLGMHNSSAQLPKFGFLSSPRVSLFLSVMGNSWDQGWDSTTLLLSVL